jgi:hypothetical protein
MSAERMPARTHYDIHGLVTMDIHGPNSQLCKVLDRSLAHFRDDGEGADFTLDLGSYPSPEWAPKGSTVGDRMLYDPTDSQTTVFSKVMGNALRIKDVQYVITGDPRVGTGPVKVNVPDNYREVSRVRRAGVEALDLEGRRAILALAGDPLFRMERTEQEAEGILQTLLEPFLYYRLVPRGSTFVHGSGLSANGSGFLIVGLANVGKTSLALELVKEGYGYYGDDLPIVSSDGDLLSNPKPIKLRSQHVELYPELASKLLRKMNGSERFFLSRQVKGHNAEVMKRLPRLSIEDMIDNAKVGHRIPLRTVIFLRRMSGKDFYVDELDRESLVRGVAGDLFFQFPCAPWRRTMYYFCPSVALGNDFMAEEEQHHKRISEILNGAFSKAKIVRLNAPMDYPSEELERQIARLVS